MRKAATVLAVAMLLWACVGPALGQLGSSYFDIRSDGAFADVQSVLHDYVRARSRTRHNNVCVIGYQARDGSRSAWVIWRGARRIILWEPGNDLSESRRTIDLRKDVVASEKDLNGSTYRVTRPWVNELVARCAKDGTTLDIAS